MFQMISLAMLFSNDEKEETTLESILLDQKINLQTYHSSDVFVVIIFVTLLLNFVSYFGLEPIATCSPGTEPP